MSDLSFDQRWALSYIRRSAQSVTQAQKTLGRFQNLGRDYGLSEDQIEEASHG